VTIYFRLMPRVRRVCSRILSLKRAMALGAIRLRGSRSLVKLNPRNFLCLAASVISPLRFANPSPPSGWVEDLHLLAVEHARHTIKNPASREAGFLFLLRELEKELQTELQDARQVRVVDFAKGSISWPNATRIAGRIVSSPCAGHASGDAASRPLDGCE